MAVVGGGDSNTASGALATVAGGGSNVAAGSYSFVSGTRAKANHNYTFVWNDQGGADFTSTAGNQFLIHASNGVGIGTASPADSLHVAGGVRIVDGTQSAGRTLVSDANGRGRWTGNVGARVGSNAGQSISTETVAATTVVTFNTEDFDNGSLHDNVTNNSRITIVESGVYIITANVEWGSTIIGDSIGVVGGEIAILRNGIDTIVKNSSGNGFVATRVFAQEASTVAHLNSGDYIEVFVSHGESEAKYILSKPSYSPRFAATLVR